MKILLTMLVVVILMLVSINNVGARTTQEDVDKVEQYMVSMGIYTILMQDSVFITNGSCSGTYYITLRAIHTECGKKTSLDSFMAVMLHEAGHSLQDKHKHPNTFERYMIEVDAWDRGEVLAKELKVWKQIDKIDYRVQLGISLLSYSRIVNNPVNLIH